MGAADEGEVRMQKRMLGGEEVWGRNAGDERGRDGRVFRHASMELNQSRKSGEKKINPSFCLEMREIVKRISQI